MPKSTKTLGKKFKATAVLEIEIAQLKDENRALKATIDKFLKKEQEKKSLTTNVLRLELTPEQEIVETQIQYLRMISIDRTLTYDETRMLDIHIKNKRLMDDKSTVNADYKKMSEEFTEEDLIEIAGSVDDVSESEEKVK